MKNTDRQYIIMGAGGHAAVIADVLYQSGRLVKGFLDDRTEAGSEVLGVKVLGKLDSCSDYPECLFLIAIGYNEMRKRVSRTYPVEFGVAVHPSAIIGRQVEIGRGSVVMAGSVINVRTTIGEHCIVNTRASIDHDNILGDYVHISPGAVLGGGVSIGTCTHIGLGACVRNTVEICGGVVVGAGASVVKDITEPGTYIGVPAKRMSQR